MIGRRAVVTGASGHLGYHVAKQLLHKGISTDVLIRKGNENTADLANRGARIIPVDLRDPEALTPIFSGAEVVFHLAAENTTDTARVREVLENTADLAKCVLSCAVNAAVPVIVYTSSVVVLGRSPARHRLLSENDRATTFESPYVRGKVEGDRFCEKLMAESGADIRRVYPSWVTGPGDPKGTPPHQLINRCVRQGQHFWFSGGISLTSVEEVALGHVNAWLIGRPKAQYVLGGSNITFKELFDEVSRLSGKSPPRIFLPKLLIVTGAEVLSRVLKPFAKKSPIEPEYARAIIGSYSWYDSSRAIKELGYKVVGAKILLRDAVRLERMRLFGTYNLGRVRNPQPEFPAEDPTGARPLLLTGVPGWLGNRFVDVLMNGLDSRPPSLRPVHLLVEPRHAELLNLPPRFKVFPADLGDKEALRSAVEGVATVIHLAGAIYPPQIATLYRVNSEGTRNLVDACIAAKVRRFLYMSTDSVCGHGTKEERLFTENSPAKPYSDYGASKYMAEQYLFEKTAAGEIDGTVLRGFWFFGPYAPARQRNFLRMMRKERQIVFGTGKNYRSISHVDNTITAFLAAENAPDTIGKWYWIGDEKADYTVDEIYTILCQANGSEYRPIYLPGWVCGLMRLLDSGIRKLGRLHPTIHGIGKFDLDIAGSIAAAKRDFGYAPVTSLSKAAKHGEL